MDNILPKGSSTPADFPEATWAVNALKGIVFAGAFCGMIAMGYIGDLLGRRMGMMTTLSLVVVGSLGSAIAPWLPAGAVYYALTVLRFVLGFGVVRVVWGAAPQWCRGLRRRGRDLLHMALECARVQTSERL